MNLNGCKRKRKRVVTVNGKEFGISDLNEKMIKKKREGKIIKFTEERNVR